MSFIRTVVGIWKSHEETSEKHQVEELKTRYYNKSREAIIDIIQRIVSQKLTNWQITKIDKERGEVVIDKKQGSPSVMVITIFKINPIKSAVDVYCSKDGTLGDFGSSYRNILTFLSVLDKEIR
jgi:hypothetical protein